MSLGDRRVALLLGEVLTAELQVGQIHGETTVLDELLKLGVAHRTEASMTSTLPGTGTWVFSVVLTSREASRASTGLIT